MRTFIGVILILAGSISGLCQVPASTTEPAQVQTPFGPASTGASRTPMVLDPSWPTRVFSIRYVEIRYINNLLSAFGVPVSQEPNLKAISVRAPSPTLTAIEELIKRFDIPANAAKNVELTGYLLVGSSQNEPDSTPPSIRSVVDQLRTVMAYKSYRVIDTIIARGSEGDEISSNGMIARMSEADPAGLPIYEEFRVRARVSGEGADQVIHLESLRLTVKAPVSGNNYQNFSIGTAIDVKKGQQVVVGKATFQDRALILVLSAKVVD